MNIDLDLQINTSLETPAKNQLLKWVSAALVEQSLSDNKTDAELSILIVDTEESQTLNRDYRQQDKPTNVLSFPAELPDFVDIPLLGDLVICAPIVVKEAQEQNKTATSHWAHMVVHGTLHLLGYDHIGDDAADTMEALEVQILKQLGFSNPY